MSDASDSSSKAPAGAGPEDPVPSRIRRMLSFFRRLPAAVLALGVSVLALSAVWECEQILLPHAEHVRARAALQQINQSLSSSLDRRFDLRGDLEVTFVAGKDAPPNPAVAAPREEGRPSFPYRMEPVERERYRRAAVAELYDIGARIASLVRRGNEQVESLGNRDEPTARTYAALCNEAATVFARKNIACPQEGNGDGAMSSRRPITDRLFDAAATPGTYAETVYHAGSLGLILVGFLAIGTAILSVFGAAAGVTVEMVRELLFRIVPTGASIATLVAGVVGAGAVVAGVSAATVAGIELTIVDKGPTSGAAACPGTTCCQRDPANQGPATMMANTYTFGDLVTNEYFDSRSDVERAVSSLVTAVETIGARAPVIVRVPAASDRALVNAIGGGARAVSDSIAASRTASDQRLAALSTQVIAVSRALDQVVQEQQATRRAVEDKTAETTLAVNAVAKTTEKVVDNNTAALSPIVTYTSCQVAWQRSLQNRNGIQRLWHVLGGYRADPCDPKGLPAGPKVGGAATSEPIAETTGDRRSSHELVKR